MKSKTTFFTSSSKTFAAYPLKQSAKVFWLVWLLTILVISFLFISTMEIAPFLHIDEILTVNLGRNILYPATDWSIAWLTELNEPVFILSYLGPVLQELAFQSLGQYGPRISGLIGGIAAATALVGWLHARGTKLSAAFLLGVVFLLDPLFVQAFAMGRVDGWAMVFCLGSCWVLRDIIQWRGDNRSNQVRIILAGALTAVGVFIWTSAVFLIPLVLLELANNVRANGTVKEDIIQRVQIPLILFGCGGLMATLLLLCPIAPQLYVEIGNVIESLRINTQSGSAFGQSENPVVILFRMLKFTPALVLVAIISIGVRKEVGLLLAGLVATALMLVTVVYIHRVLYLVPYFVLAASNLFHQKHSNYNGSNSMIRSLRVGSLAVLLTWSIGMSLFARPLLALSQSTETERNLLSRAAQTMVGEGNHAVLSPFEFYYVGTALGWKMFRPYKAVGETFSSDIMQQVLPHVDYVIMIQQELTEDIVSELINEGFIDHGWYHVYKDPVERFEYGMTIEDKKYLGNIWRLRTVYSIFRQPYGPYKLYSRETKKRLSSAI